jgi:hypothetical protein
LFVNDRNHSREPRVCTIIFRSAGIGGDKRKIRIQEEEKEKEEEEEEEGEEEEKEE